jgi:glycosyltransferase involved in cell wall biosynthesis
VGTLVEALRQVDGAALALVGGPDDMAEALRRQWLEAGLSEARFLYAGHVRPEHVPLYLSAFDVCAMPFPWTDHFAYYASPIKLFEYMASRRAIVASDLPAFAEVVQDGESALLVPPSDVDALAAAIKRLRDNPALRARLADCAYERVMAHYTWAARAEAILEHISLAVPQDTG